LDDKASDPQKRKGAKKDISSSLRLCAFARDSFVAFLHPNLKPLPPFQSFCLTENFQADRTASSPLTLPISKNRFFLKKIADFSLFAGGGTGLAQAKARTFRGVVAGQEKSRKHFPNRNL
jgi:hypothetical protein